MEGHNSERKRKPCPGEGHEGERYPRKYELPPPVIKKRLYPDSPMSEDLLLQETGRIATCITQAYDYVVIKIMEHIHGTGRKDVLQALDKLHHTYKMEFEKNLNYMEQLHEIIDQHAGDLSLQLK